MNMLDLSGRRALVVGGTSGIGNAIACRLRDRGAAVHAWGTRASASDYSEEEGSDLRDIGYSQVDVSDPEAVASVGDPFPGLDILVQSQGAVRYRRQEFEQEGWRDVMRVNCDSVMQIATRFHPMLAKSEAGSIVVVASIGAFRATIGTPAYAASKAAVVGLVRTLGKAWAGEGIRVNAIAPSLVDTKMTKVTMDHAERRDAALAKIPLGRFGTVEEMADVALFLASPMAGYICGQTIVCDGGLTL